MHPYDAARQGKSVDRRVIYDKKPELLITVLGMRTEILAKALNVLLDLRVREYIARRPNTLIYSAPNLRFLLLGQNRIGWAADIRQVFRLSIDQRAGKAERNDECNEESVTHG